VRDYTEVAWQPHGRVLVFDVHPDRIETGIDAIAVIGQPDFTSYEVGGIGPQQLGSIDQEAFDEEHQRLFITDRTNNRVMVWDVHPDRLTDTPEAIAVLGQPGFTSNTPGGGATGFNRPGDLYYEKETDRLFVADMGNNRVLVFDAAPGMLETGMAASEVLGQPDFESNSTGTAADRFDTPSELHYEHVFDRLFVMDGGGARGFQGGTARPNPRLLVFSGAEDVLRTGARAAHVLGQADFTGREPRTDTRKWSEGVVLDEETQRLFANEGDRLLVFDIHPDRLTDNPDATNLLFAEDWEEGFGPDAPVVGLGIVSQTQETAVKVPMLDADTQKMYTATSYTGRNAISIWDISTEYMQETGTPVRDVLGQYDWAGNVDFSSRAANGRVNDRFVYPRGTALDAIDHRLFVNDQYLHRVLVFDLDDENRPLDRQADIVLGQPDFFTGDIRLASDRDLNIPLALAYDPVAKHLFVADGGNNRIMVFDADPVRLETYDAAIAVIGQSDFTSKTRELSARAINFGVGFGRGIMSTSPLPMGFAVDPVRRRLFVSDGINHRVLVFDIRSGQVRTGMSATSVIGQPDFESNTPGIDDGGFNTPSGLDYDPDHDRLFVVDGNNHRVLVFDASPADIREGQAAVAALGQYDFTSVDPLRLDTTDVVEDVGRRRMRMPSGIAYDRVRQELYVNDKGNDRILIFDAAPDVLQTGMAAASVIGQPNFVTRIAGDGEQEQLLDPRQLAFDSNQRRLYVADSFWGRLMIFDMPRNQRTMVLEGYASKTYGTIDAWNGRPQPNDLRLGMPQADERLTWRSVLDSDGTALGATLVYHNTRQEMDPESLRRSRVLISETSVLIPAPRSSALHFVLEGEDTDSRLVVSNPESVATDVRFRLQIADREFGATRTLPQGTQLVMTLSELFGRDVAGAGTLRVTSEDADVSSFLLYETRTRRDEQLLLAGIDGATPPSMGGDQMIALPGLKWGGGYRSEVVLLNPHATVITGEIAFFDHRGEPVTVEAGSNRITYEIEPDGLFRWQQDDASAWPKGAYAVIDTDAQLPAGGAVVSLWRESLLVTQTSIPLRSTTQHAWVPVDTQPSFIRHGRSRMSFTIANPTHKPATLRFTLFDTLGQEQGRYEQVLPPYREQQWRLGDLFNRQQFAGAVRLWSDVPVGVSAERTTETLRGEPVADQLRYLTEQSLQARRYVEVPGIVDGEGLVTEVMLTNPSSSAVNVDWRFLSSQGQPRDIVLR